MNDKQKRVIEKTCSLLLDHPTVTNKMKIILKNVLVQHHWKAMNYLATHSYDLIQGKELLINDPEKELAESHLK